MLHTLKKRLRVREEERHGQGHPATGGQCENLKPSQLEPFPHILCTWLNAKYILAYKQLFTPSSWGSRADEGGQSWRGFGTQYTLPTPMSALEEAHEPLSFKEGDRQPRIMVSSGPWRKSQVTGLCALRQVTRHLWACFLTWKMGRRAVPLSQDEPTGCT